ncbi:aminoglycoside phosphotransferase family protein [Roseovarius sp. M141]|uniref:aminoglycoside phosphotransferase family protein n=1 Tax=Roseovarius sp. M141 TaxID=2583806 RepID=UPI0020CB8E22|nr:phosphotransferase [Roseovarius sp. M141]MCQ0091475.1 aminoglycoside phosphotransferase [Roseovarius sp. M141]
MTDRTAKAMNFLSQTVWAGATAAALAGDASNRRYLRIRKGDETAVLMDAPAERGEDVRPFITIAEHLLALGLSAPRILAQDIDQGFLLIEDLGDDLFARIIPRHPEIEIDLYRAATDVLIELHKAVAPADLPSYDTELMAQMAALALDWYAGADDAALRADFINVMSRTLATHCAGHEVLIQRDYHAENLLWLPDRSGAARVGLLDFQDAMRGHVAYDLVSLLQDARRDVPAGLATQMIDRYVSMTGQDDAAYQAAYHVLGAQRNLRILGVFARLCLRDGKAHYVDLIPRVWAHLMHDLNHPAMADAAPLVRRALPEPTLTFREDLKSRCALNQTQ